jgi:GT2 family glycosyltransferase
MVLKWASVGIVIPVFNRLELTIKCIESLNKIAYPNFTIIIVDDASTDGTCKHIESNYPNIKIVKGDGNLWYSGGMNAGIREALDLKMDYILFLNNDNTVNPDFLDHLIKAASDSPKTIICSLVYYEDNKSSVRFGGGRISKISGLAMAYSRHEIQIYTNEDLLYTTEYAGGMGVLVHSAHMKDIGMLDDRYFPMCGDHELWLRAIRNKNYRLAICSKAIVYGSTGQGNIRLNPSFTQLFKSVTDIRSGSYFKYVIINYYRYFPKILIPYYVIIFYGFWIIGGVTLILQKKLSMLWKLLRE